MLFLLHNSRRGGPKHISRVDPLFDDGFELPIGDDGGTDFGGGGDVVGPGAPSPIVTPEIAAQDVAGGATPAQIDLAARTETQEGASIGFYYGRLLFGALNVVSHKYEPATPRNTFTVLLGEGWSGLGRRGEWLGINEAFFLGEALTKRYDYTVWFHDFLPKGAIADPGQDGWNWIKTNPAPFIGRFSHQSPLRTGQHLHAFTLATEKLSVLTGDTITTWVWIDPTNPPTEIMLQFIIGGDGEHRAYWGANSIALGTNGTNSRRQISASIPTTGQWVRLDVPASQVGLEGTQVDGMAFILFGGSATFDQVLRWQNTMSGNTGYVFRPGVTPPNINDLVQVQDLTTWPAGTANNGAAAVTVRLSTAQSAQDRPDGFKCIAQCRLTPNYDATGTELFEEYGYSTNPARVAADRFRNFFERRYRNDPELAYEKFRARIYWPSWVAWRDYCDENIPWDVLGDGVNIFIPRFECHIGFVGDISPAKMLDQVTGLSATMWQDTGRQIVFLPPSPRAPVHHFHAGNISDGIRRWVIDLRKRPNRFIARFRDSQNQFLGIASVEPPDNTAQHALRQKSKDRVGEIRSEREFTNMNQSQASRVIEYRARLEHDNPERCALVGNRQAIHVLKGDFVTLTHKSLGWDSQLCLVLGVSLKSPERSVDQVGVTLQKIKGLLYEDGAQRPRQEALTL